MKISNMSLRRLGTDDPRYPDEKDWTSNVIPWGGPLYLLEVSTEHGPSECSMFAAAEMTENSAANMLKAMAAAVELMDRSSVASPN